MRPIVFAPMLLLGLAACTQAPSTPEPAPPAEQTTEVMLAEPPAEAPETAGSADATAGAETADAPAWQGVTWKIIEAGGAAVPEGSPASIAFNVEGQVSGNAGCNRFTGGYVAEGDGLTFQPIAGTRMMCPPEAMAVETAVFAVLQGQARVSVDADGRLVVEGAGGTLVAVPAN